MQRPDLSSVAPEIRDYIEYLEKKIIPSSDRSAKAEPASPVSSEILFTEPQTTQCVFTISQAGQVKRTYRHFYSRQHRGGMGVFDLDTNAPDYPKLLACADESQTLLIFTDKARVYRYAAKNIEPQPVRAHGTSSFDRLGLDADEQIISILPEQAHGYVALVSRIGKVRSLRHHLFGEHMRQGNSLFNVNEFGPLAAVCWSPGDTDLFIATRSGVAIRFNEKSLPPQGGLGIRVADGDAVVGITPVDQQSSVFLLGADGKGTVRLMNGFAGNKTPGGNGKIAIKNDNLVGAAVVSPEDEIVSITRLGKIIRFLVDEVPSTEGVIQGVNCIGMRLDEVTGFAVIVGRVLF